MKDRINSIKWFIQRGKRGWADCDTWSLDWYLSEWMPKAIRHLKDTSNAHPPTMTFRQWKYILELIARGFEADFKMKDEIIDDKRLQKRKERGLKLFIKYYDNLWE